MSAKIPRPDTPKISELSILVPSAVRIIDNARIMDRTDTHVTLRYRKPRSVKRWEQIFPMSQVLFIRDRGVETPEEVAADEADAGQTEATPRAPKRVCDAVVVDTFQLDEYADIASIDKLEGTKVFATTVEGDLIVADTSICRFVQDVAANAQAAAVVLSQPTVVASGGGAPVVVPKEGRAARPPRAQAKFDS